MIKTKKELQAALIELGTHELEVTMISGWRTGETLITTWDVLQVLDYKLIVKEENLYYPQVKVKLAYADVWVPFKDIQVKLPNYKKLLESLISRVCYDLDSAYNYSNVDLGREKEFKAACLAIDPDWYIGKHLE